MEIGEYIAKSRVDMALTQDQFGKKYSVSGPAIFKFEKSYVKPSLDLWLKMAKDIKLKEAEAVLMWVRAKLPSKFQAFVSLEPATAKETKKAGKAKKAPSPDVVRTEVLANRATAKGLKTLLKDDDLWALYQPTSAEIRVLADVFGSLGAGTKSSFRQALQLIRTFSVK